MANQDILYSLWIKAGRQCKSIPLSAIETFAFGNEAAFLSKTGAGGISTPGLNYTVLRFILNYCQPVNWPAGTWNEFNAASDNRKGNYGIWKRHPHLCVDILPSGLPPLNLCASTITPRVLELKKSDLDPYISWFVKTIDEHATTEGKGWLGLLRSYQWPKGKGSYEEGIALRIAFHTLVKNSVMAAGIGARTYRQGLNTAIVGWGGIDSPVDSSMTEQLFRSIQYLQSVEESCHIDLNRIYEGRIASSSKVYYFSNPRVWTIFDSRVAYALNSMAEKYAEEYPDHAAKISKDIQFAIPPNRQGRQNLKMPWNDDCGVSSFVRASMILRYLTSKLNERNILPPSLGIFSQNTWELCHVEMAMFMYGE